MIDTVNPVIAINSAAAANSKSIAVTAVINTVGDSGVYRCYFSLDGTNWDVWETPTAGSTCSHTFDNLTTRPSDTVASYDSSATGYNVYVKAISNARNNTLNSGVDALVAYANGEGASVGLSNVASQENISLTAPADAGSPYPRRREDVLIFY